MSLTLLYDGNKTKKEERESITFSLAWHRIYVLLEWSLNPTSNHGPTVFISNYYSYYYFYFYFYFFFEKGFTRLIIQLQILFPFEKLKRYQDVQLKLLQQVQVLVLPI